MQIRLPQNLWELVALSGGLHWPLLEESDEELFVARCAREGLLPIAFRSLTLPGLDQWRAMDSALGRRSSLLSRTISALPDRIGEKYLLLKGADVAYRLYPSPELRPMADIDVLVQPGSLARVVARLEAAGALRRYSRPRQMAADTPDYAFDLGVCTLEVHHAIVHRASARIDYTEVWANAVETPTGLRLSDSHALVTATLNIAKDNLSTSLLRFLDLWLMISPDASIVEEALAQAERWKVANAVHTVLRMTELFFPELKLPLERRDRLDSIAAKAAGSRIRPGLLERFRRKYWLIDRMDLRFGYLSSTLRAIGYGLLRSQGILSVPAVK